MKKEKKSNTKLKKQNGKNLFITNIRNIFEKIMPGLQEGKCLIKDGLINLSKEDDELLQNEDNTEYIVMLTIMIQAYPKNECEFENGDEELLQHINSFILMISLAKLFKYNLISLEYGKNKIDPVFLEQTNLKANDIPYPYSHPIP